MKERDDSVNSQTLQGLGEKIESHSRAKSYEMYSDDDKSDKEEDEKPDHERGLIHAIRKERKIFDVITKPVINRPQTGGKNVSLYKK